MAEAIAAGSNGGGIGGDEAVSALASAGATEVPAPAAPRRSEADGLEFASASALGSDAFAAAVACDSSDLAACGGGVAADGVAEGAAGAAEDAAVLRRGSSRSASSERVPPSGLSPSFGGSVAVAVEGGGGSAAAFVGSGGAEFRAMV